jgi:hypothetical protein
MFSQISKFLRLPQLKTSDNMIIPVVQYRFASRKGIEHQSSQVTISEFDVDGVGG